ncbi:MAG: dicarboxylate--CoA ligase PimA [Phyllobacteriaceae bacterium]|nr:dicarboxylate--CoA ligase PimA [Phyllobacteriaceae bacterium]MBA92478.1 dicarboxylate--CoA ligase PimA [Phyllobacteriaceae bacterium]
MTPLPAPPAGGWPWEKVYPGGRLPDPGALSLFPIQSILEDGASDHPGRTALEFRGRAITFGELDRMAVEAAAGLARAGVRKGDRVAVLLPNTPAHPVSFFGLMKTGAVVVHLSPLDAPAVLAHKLTDSGARILVTTNFGALATGAALLAEKGLVDRVVVFDDAAWGPSGDTGAMPAGPAITTYDDFIAGAGDPPEVATDIDDLALLQYTGGTTGMPKAAMLTHRNISGAVSSYTAWYDIWGLTRPEGESVLVYLPLFHIYGLSAVLLRSLKGGNTCLLRTRFDPVAALDEIEAGANVLPGVPTMWIAMTQTPGFEKRDLSALTLAASGGAPMPVEVAHRFTSKTGLELLGGWGMSETSPAGTNLPRGWPQKAGTIGIPLPGCFLRVVDLSDPARELPQGETGELAIRGNNVTSGYWNRPEETQASFADGWFLTGDIGFMDEDGFFTIVDRKKDMIISGGFNVYPQMIEQAIYTHPDVEEALVIGVPDGYRGESAKAYVKLREGAPDLTLEVLQAHLKERLGPHEMPRALEIRDALPRTPVGKLSKIDLKREAAAQARAALNDPKGENHG